MTCLKTLLILMIANRQDQGDNPKVTIKKCTNHKKSTSSLTDFVFSQIKSLYVM